MTHNTPINDDEFKRMMTTGQGPVPERGFKNPFKQVHLTLQESRDLAAAIDLFLDRMFGTEPTTGETCGERIDPDGAIPQLQDHATKALRNIRIAKERLERISKEYAQ